MATGGHFCKEFRNELRIPNILLEGREIRKDTFYTAHFECITPKIRIITQGVITLYLVVWMIISLANSIDHHGSAIWFTWLTSVNYMLCTAFFITAFILHILHHTSKDGKEDSDKITWREKLYWFLFTTSLVIGFFVVIFFWAALFKPDEIRDALHLFFNIDRHGIFYLFLVYEFAVSRIPIRIMHYIYVFALLALYLLFSYVYYGASGGKLIYNILDWGDIKKPIAIIFGVIAFTVLAHLLFYFIDYKKRKSSQRVEIIIDTKEESMETIA